MSDWGIFQRRKGIHSKYKTLLYQANFTMNQRKNRGRKNRKTFQGSGTPGPVSFATNIGVRNYRIRYRVTSALEGTYSLLVVARTFFMAYATNTTAVSMCQAIRIRSIEAWCAADADQTNRTISLGWNSVPGAILNTRLMQKTDTAFSINDTAHVKIVPPKNSTFGWWFTVEGSSSPGSFQLSVQAETVLDIVFDADFNLPSNAVSPTAPSAVTVSSPTPLPGFLYFGFWDTNVQP